MNLRMEYLLLFYLLGIAILYIGKNMSHNNIPFEPESFNLSMPSLPNFNSSMYLIETNKNVPIYSINCLDQKPLQEQKIEHSIEADINQVKNVPETAKRRKQGCACKKTMCLKMYCECFRKGKTCISSCHCNQCNNDGNHQDMLLKAKEDLKHKGSKGRSFGGGCNCKKSNCRKKYCECFNAKMGCSETCRCVNCLNQQAEQQEILSHQMMNKEE